MERWTEGSRKGAFIDGALTSCSCIKLILKAINTHRQGRVMKKPPVLNLLDVSQSHP